MKSKSRADTSGTYDGTVGALLHEAHADERNLHAATREFHHSASIAPFPQLQELLARQREDLDRWLEEIDERARTLEPRSETTNRSAGPGQAEGDGARVGPQQAPRLATRAILAELFARHEEMASRLREDVRVCAGRFRDNATAQFLSRLRDFHESTAWLLGALLAPRKPGAGQPPPHSTQPAAGAAQNPTLPC